ncbi:hypothetical protein CR513_17761, partial [Mucuna pruriens]
MKHPTEDHSLFGIDLIDELVEEYLQLDSNSEDIVDLIGSTDQINCLGPFTGKADYEEVRDLPNYEDNHNDIADLDFEAELSEMLAQVCNLENLECTNRVEVEVVETKNGPRLEAIQKADADSNSTSTEPTKGSRPRQPKAEIMSAHLVPSPNQVGQIDPKSSIEKSSSPPPHMELKPLPNHLKYAYLDKEQQIPVIIAKNLHQEQEDKLLEVLRQHKRAMGWKLSYLSSINPSISTYRILMEEEIKPIRKQQRRLNLKLLDVVRKEVNKLLTT